MIWASLKMMLQKLNRHKAKWTRKSKPDTGAIQLNRTRLNGTIRTNLMQKSNHQKGTTDAQPGKQRASEAPAG